MHERLTTAQAILAVAEEMSARAGTTNIKLADIAAELGIEPPSIYRHYSGLKGVIAALGEVALRAEIETFADIERLPFCQALKLQAERCFDLYMRRPGLARFIMVDLALPGGVHVFEDTQNPELVAELFRLEQELLDRGVQEREIRSMSVTMFVAARLGPAITAFALKELQVTEVEGDTETLKREYIETVMAGLKAK